MKLKLGCWENENGVYIWLIELHLRQQVNLLSEQNRDLFWQPNVYNIAIMKNLLLKALTTVGCQKLSERTKGLRRKAWTGTTILSSDIRYVVAILRFVAHIFEDFGQKSALSGQK